MANSTYLEETRLLNYSHKDITELTDSRGWAELELYGKIGAAYHFVKDEIAFGYNESDDVPASKILSDSYGQCNTKTTLLMALLRRLRVPCRIHGFRVDRKVQEGIVPEPFYRLAPSTLLHTWTEVEFQGRWLSLEGCILDQDYLSAVQSELSTCEGGVCGYGVAVAEVRNPAVVWRGAHTHIQVDSIVEDLGIFDSPEAIYRQHGANLRPAKRFIFKHFVRKLMNRRVQAIRSGRLVPDRIRGSVSSGR